MRRRSSTSAASGTSIRKGRISVGPMEVSTWVMVVSYSVDSLTVAVRGQELRQRRQHLLGGLLGDPVAGAGDDHGLHVVRGGLHPVPGLFTPALRSADRQDGHRKRPVLALRVLCEGGV